MGKQAGYSSTKAIANQIKSKGLQKLRWYCQMCQKQFKGRDDNGFKNHCSSESHQRNMLNFSERSGGIIWENSRIFCNGFVKILSHRHSTNRVHSNLVYQEFIADRNHIHLSGTRWGSVREFCYYLDRKGICKVDENEKGVFLTWIDTSPGLREKQEALDKKMRSEKSDADTEQKLLEEMMENAKNNINTNAEASTPTDLIRTDEKEPIKLQMNVKMPKTKIEFKKLETLAKKPFDLKSQEPCKSSSSAPVPALKKLTALEEIIQTEMRKKQKRG